MLSLRHVVCLAVHTSLPPFYHTVALAPYHATCRLLRAADVAARPGGYAGQYKYQPGRGAICCPGGTNARRLGRRRRRRSPTEERGEYACRYSYRRCRRTAEPPRSVLLYVARHTATTPYHAPNSVVSVTPKFSLRRYENVACRRLASRAGVTASRPKSSCRTAQPQYNVNRAPSCHHTNGYEASPVNTSRQHDRCRRQGKQPCS
jgi:hypothetical protein